MEKNIPLNGIASKHNIPLTGKFQHRSKLLRLGTLKIYSFKRVIPLTDIPLSGFDCICFCIYCLLALCPLFAWNF